MAVAFWSTDLVSFPTPVLPPTIGIGKVKIDKDIVGWDNWGSIYALR